MDRSLTALAGTDPPRPRPDPPARAARPCTTLSSPAPARPGSDAALIARSLADAPAFAGVFDRHWPAIHGFCTSRAGAAGEDIAADTFRVAFGDRRRFDGRSDDAAPWLYGIATNLLRRHFRTAERGRRAAERAAVDGGAGDGSDDSLGRLEAERLAPHLASALATLPAADRDALLLVAWAGLGYEEVAQALGVPVGTVRSRLHRARSRVRAQLAADRSIPLSREDDR